jgi:hypothetical protein
MKWCKKQIKNTSQASIWGTYWPVFMGSDVPSDVQAELIQPQAPQTIFPMDGRADVGGRCALRRAQTQKTNQSRTGQAVKIGKKTRAEANLFGPQSAPF